MKSHEELFFRFGGHEGACGFSMKRDKLETLEALLEQDMKRMLDEDPELFSRLIRADLSLPVEKVTLELAQELELLAPFGSKNPKPLFLLENIRAARLQPMGADGKHMRFYAVSQDGKSVECVLFNRAEDFKQMLYGEASINLIGSVDFQEWRGNKRVQFNVESVV